jgi:hypothetical protein
MAKILEETRNSPYRGWEWGYWNGVLHDSDEEYVLDSPAKSAYILGKASRDGKQILLVDPGLRLALLVDRSKKEVVGRFSLGKDEGVGRTKSAWIAIDNESKIVRDLLTGKVYANSITPKHEGYLTGIDGTDYLVYAEYPQTVEGTTGKAIMLDLKTGHQLFSVTERGHTVDISGVSRDGHRLLTSRQGNIEKSRSLEDFRRENVLYDSSRKVLDRWPSPNGVFAPRLSASGRFSVEVFSGRLTVRDTSQRRQVLTVEGKEDGAIMTGEIDESAGVIVCLHQNSRVTVRSLKSGQVLSRWRNAASFERVPGRTELILSGSTVRVVSWRDRKEPSPNGILIGAARGRFLARSFSPSGLQFYSDPGLEPLGDQIPFTLSGLVSYNGRVSAQFEGEAAERRSVIREFRSGRRLLASKEGWSMLDSAGRTDFYVVASRDKATVLGYRYGESNPLWVRKISGPKPWDLRVSYSGAYVLVLTPNSAEILDGRSGRRVSIHAYPEQSTGGFLRESDDYWVASGGKGYVYAGVSHKLVATLNAGSTTIA